jgi:hypothetical protein
MSTEKEKTQENSPIHVAILPPGVGGLKLYVISTDEYGGMKFATEDGSFVTFHRKAVGFATVSDAIAFAEMHGWIVMNKRDNHTLIDVNARIKEIKLIEAWMESYIQNLGFSNPSEVANLVWKCSENPESSRIFDEYGAKILLPLAHAFVHNWKGRDSHAAFRAFAKRFGIASIEYICWMQVYGFDDTYGDTLHAVLKDSVDDMTIAQEFIRRRGRGIWMACTAGYDVLHENLPRASSISGRDLEGFQVTISNAKFLTENIWSDRFRYLDTTIKEFILDEAQAIVKDFSNFQKVGALKELKGLLRGPKVFIAYSRSDYSFAADIYWFLRNNECNPWMDIYNLIPGQDWELEIHSNIKTADLFIACLSNNSVSKRGYFQKELREAISVLEQMPEGAIYTIPVRIDDCLVPASLERLHWVDWSAPNAKEMLAKVIESKK